MKLSLRDRYIILKRAIKLALKPDVSNVTFLWESEEYESTKAHAIFAEGTSKTQPIFNYFAMVASKVDDLDRLNHLTANHNLLVLQHYAKRHNLTVSDYGVRKYPFTYIADKEAVAPEETTMTVLVDRT